MDAEGVRQGNGMYEMRHLLGTLTLGQILATMPENHSRAPID